MSSVMQMDQSFYRRRPMPERPAILTHGLGRGNVSKELMALPGACGAFKNQKHFQMHAVLEFSAASMVFAEPTKLCNVLGH
jgi:tRNA U34 5-carboxymethylaminomethyl modifying enzyme MnmG/GidA